MRKAVAILCVVLAAFGVVHLVRGAGMCGCEYRYDLLMEFYYATNGPEWTNHSGWGNTSVCATDWFGVTCGTCSTCVTGFDIQSVAIRQNNLRGTLPASWGNLSSLTTLSIYSNQINGTLPASWGAKSSLNTVSIYNNSLSGTLPASWETLPRVSWISLYSNSLSGTLPPSWGNLTSLVSFYLYLNNLSGTLPASWGNLFNIQTLSLYSNSLEGTLPAQWNGMSKLQWLTINSNRLSGPLPESWGTMTKFTRLTIFSNSLNGTLPASWDTMSGLQTLTMSNNSLSGTLPPSWGNMPILQTLSLDSNSLNGTLPDSWATMPKLQALNIDSNSLGGTLPSSWGTMPSLATLSLNVNSLSGTLPASWNSISLTALSLGSNIFNGTLPASWSSMFRLTSLALNFNDLNGTLPASWNSMWDLQTLYLNSNSLSGTLPASWDSMFSLASLALNFNSLNGTLPASWSTMSRLTTLSLASNSLSGSLPASWGGMSRLQTLDISSNALEGTIPAQWSQMGYQMVSANQSLRVRLNLSVSFLNGSVPASFAQNNGSKPCLNIFSTHISSKFSSRNVWNCNWSSFYNIAVPTSSHTLSPPASFSTTADRSDAMDAPHSITQSISASQVEPAEISTTNVTSSSSSISTTVPLVVGIRSPPAITVKSLAQIASGVGAALAVIAAAPSNGFAINRLATLSNLGDCSDAVRQTVEGVMTDGIPTLLDAPLQLSFGDEFGASQRGSVLGNLLVLIIVGFVSVGAVVVHRCVNGMRPRAILSHRGLFLKSAATLRLPGSMVISVVLLLDVLVTSSVLLVSYGVHVSDAVLGVAALLVVSVVFFGTCFVLDPRTLSFQAVALHVRQIAICDKLVPTQSVRVRIAALWDHITSPSNEWETRKLQRKGNPLFVAHYGHLFEGCRGGRHWWILVEASTTIIVSMLRSVVSETEAACVTRAWIALALVSVVLVALIAAWPMNTHIETGTSIALSGAQVVVIACAIGGVGDVADVIGLSVSISSAALALLPIALWMTSFLSWECRSLSGNKKTPHSVVPCEMRPLSLTQMLHKIKSTHSVVSNCSELDTTTVALRVIIELICDLSHFE